MKKRLVLFVCAAIALFGVTLSTCGENQQVIGILRDASMLEYLGVAAYADNFPLTGGATLEPTFQPSVFEYTVHIADDANRFIINASLGAAAGTVTCFNEQEQLSGTEFDYYNSEPFILRVTAQRDYMNKGEYTLTVQRMSSVPVATDMATTVYPSIASFFIGSGVIPVISVTASLPLVNGEPTGELSYQWYMNTQNNTLGGLPLSGETGASYTMKPAETFAERTIYYFAEITNTIDGKAGVTRSPPRSVTFINKSGLSEKSVGMVTVPAGHVDSDINGGTNRDWWNQSNPTYMEDFPDWDTPGFLMGKYPVTWELWKAIFDWAEAENYRFARIGNQGAAYAGRVSTNYVSIPIGNKFHPVTKISWIDAVVWCNAYSEMEGLEPVYLDRNTGQPLRDSRLPVDRLVDAPRMAGKNGYRLPTIHEWLYAAAGADPSDSRWFDLYPGTNDTNETGKYLWVDSPERLVLGYEATGEVGSMLPNSIGLYDMTGMVSQWVDWLIQLAVEQRTTYAGSNFYRGGGSLSKPWWEWCEPSAISSDPEAEYVGFRFVRNR